MVKKILALLAWGIVETTPVHAQESGLLFHLSGNEGFEADYAAGDKSPNYLNNQVQLLPNGKYGTYLHCQERQLLSYWAPKNIYAQRGTISFFWRADTPFTPTEFPIFRVAYADHSSWDMVFLRIDYNGHGFDAFVTDANLARVRVSYTASHLPNPKEWIHMALTWDENKGIRFYINGKKVGEKNTTTVLDAALDQFGPHSRIISPYQVQTKYNFMRGGDIDEIRIYDQMLDDEAIVELSNNLSPQVNAWHRQPADVTASEEWQKRYGFEKSLPPYLKDDTTYVRKVQISEVYDHKRWWWKANDGIKETTWPGVYNRSRIPGRNDYFQLPDWDCYSVSGKQVRFNMPQEPWNHIEIYGAAYGKIGLTKDKEGKQSKEIFTREKNVQRSVHRLTQPIVGQTLVFTNEEQETPIGEFDTYLVEKCEAIPQGVATLSYRLTTSNQAKNDNLNDLEQYIKGRYPSDERATLTAFPLNYAVPVSDKCQQSTSPVMPLAHILIPSDYRSMVATSNLSSWSSNTSYTWKNIHAGLDGIFITLPELNIKGTIEGLIALNLSVKDPVWPLRSMLDISFSVKPNEQRSLWLDLRDRILPNNRPLYLTLACGNQDFNASMLEGTRVDLVFKEYEEAQKEHIADRFTQVRDNFAMIVEENTNHLRLQKYVQYENDITELLRVDPMHQQGREYWYFYNHEQNKPTTNFAPQPNGVPLWAHLQMEYLKLYREFIEWQIDHRQIENGEFGGGISDDSDLTNWFPSLALMGCIPEKLEESLSRLMEACYDQKMITKGMSTIQTDGLHTFEEGTNVIAQLNLLRTGNPKEVNRMLEAAKTVNDRLIGINKAGHTHFKSDYFSATKMATEGVWAWSSDRESLHLIPAIYLAELYGNEQAKKLIIDMADGFLAHAKKDEKGRWDISVEINFNTDERRSSGMGNTAPLFWAAWRWTGNKKYLDPLLDTSYKKLNNVTSNAYNLVQLSQEVKAEILKDASPTHEFASHLAWQQTGRKEYLEKTYEYRLRESLIQQYINTMGYVWTDRFYFDILEIQRSRLGGIVQDRSLYYPGNTITWKFADAKSAERVGILVSKNTPEAFQVEMFSKDHDLGEINMKGWDVKSGKWEMTIGIDGNSDGKIDKRICKKSVNFGREEEVKFTIPANQNVMILMKLKGKGIYNTVRRADLAIDSDNIMVSQDKLLVPVYNLGSSTSKACKVVLVSEEGVVLASTVLAPIQKVSNYTSHHHKVTLNIPHDICLERCKIVVDPDQQIRDIRTCNNTISISKVKLILQ